MPPTRAAARNNASGLAEASHSAVSFWRTKSTVSRPAAMSSAPVRSNRRTIADPTMPRWPATQTRLPASGNALRSAAAAIGLVLQFHLLQILGDHLAHQGIERRRVPPAEFVLRLARIALQVIDLGRAKVTRVDLDQGRAVLGIDAFLLDPLAAPGERAPGRGERVLDEFAHRVRLAGGEYVIVGSVLLQDHPHSQDIVAGMAPVARGVEIAEVKLLLQPEFDRRNGAGDLAGDERFAARRPFVVEKNSVRGVHAVRLAIVDGDPIGIKLRRGVGAARIERRRLALWPLPDEPVQLRGRGLIEPRPAGDAEDAHRLQKA